MNKWEYSVINVASVSSENTKSFLDNMGLKGWELISVVKNSHEMLYFFKRPKN